MNKALICLFSIWLTALACNNSDSNEKVADNRTAGNNKPRAKSLVFASRRIEKEINDSLYLIEVRPGVFIHWNTYRKTLQKNSAFDQAKRDFQAHKTE